MSIERGTNWLRSLLAAVLAAAIPAVPPCWAGDGDFQLRWHERQYVFRYNPQHRPTWLSEERALQLVLAAAMAWESCGVNLRYSGLTDRPPGVLDGENVVGWKLDGNRHSAWTTWRMRRSTGQALEADVTLYSNIFDKYRSSGIDAERELFKSLVHEFGHVLGLNHSDQPGDAMAVGIVTRPEWQLPSGNDIARCRDAYRSPPSTGTNIPESGLRGTSQSPTASRAEPSSWDRP